MSNSTDKQSCYVLHRRSYRENSLLVDLLSSASIRVSAVFRGSTAHGKHEVDLLAKYDCSWRGTSDLVSMMRCEFQYAHQLTGKQLFAALYLNELIMRTTRQNEHIDDLFTHYETALMNLEGEFENLEPTLRIFEKNLLKSLGYELVLDQLSDTGMAVLPCEYYRHEMGQGVKSTNIADEHCVSGKALLAIAQDDYTAIETRRVAKFVLRDALQFLIGDKPINSRKLFDTVEILRG